MHNSLYATGIKVCQDKLKIRTIQILLIQRKLGEIIVPSCYVFASIRIPISRYLKNHLTNVLYNKIIFRSKNLLYKEKSQAIENQ